MDGDYAEAVGPRQAGVPVVARRTKDVPTTVAVTARRWPASLALGPVTVTWYGHQVAHLVQAWPTLELTDLTRADVTEAVARWRKAKVGPRSIEARVKTLSSMFSFLCDAGHPVEHVTHQVALPKVPPKVERVLTEDELAQARAALSATPSTMALLAHDTGMRYAEIAGLGVHRVNLDRAHRAHRAGRPRAGRVGAPLPQVGAPPRDPPDRPLRRRAARAPTARRPHRHRLGVHQHARNPLGYYNVRRAWRSAVEGLAEPRPTFHDLRHTFGTRLVRAGVPLVDIGQLMGHSDLAVPQRYIAASVPDSQRSWITQALEATSASGSSSSGSGSPSARAAVSASHFK